MIRHVVMWKLKNPADAAEFKERLDACRGLVPGTVEFEVGIRSDACEANVDVVLISTFADAAALAAYQNHPQHKAVSAVLGTLRESRTVLDFETGTLPSARTPEPSTSLTTP
jgi:quinol monooxygenase YgiN